MNERFVYADRGRFCSPSGDRMRPIYHVDRHAGKAPELVQVGETDQQALIQSFSDECDINRLVARYAQGDTTVLQRCQGIYTDVSGLPTDLTTAFQTVRAAKAYYEKQPATIRELYPSLGQFLDSITITSDQDTKEVNNDVQS